MKNSKWYAAASTRNEEEYYRVTDRQTHQRIATMNGTQDEQRENACLMATAPEMYLLLKQILLTVVENGHCTLSGKGQQELADLLERAKGKL